LEQKGKRFKAMDDINLVSGNYNHRSEDGGRLMSGMNKKGESEVKLFSLNVTPYGPVSWEGDTMDEKI
jgi:hypothetical protein